MKTNFSFSVGTASGTLLSVWPNIHSEDYARTIILAIVGAAVGALASFSVTKLLRWVTRAKK